MAARELRCLQPRTVEESPADGHVASSVLDLDVPEVPEMPEMDTCLQVSAQSGLMCDCCSTACRFPGLVNLLRDAVCWSPGCALHLRVPSG